MVTASVLQERRERVYLVLASLFLGAMVMLNLIGLTRFIHIGPLALAVGVLPYPITFLVTDLISELYGKRKANFVVWVGLFLNVFTILFLWLGNLLPSVDPSLQAPWQTLFFSQPVPLPNGDVIQEKGELYYLIYACTRGAVFASMIAYLAAQFVDVYLFHFWKRLTKGKHLWLRNNGSTVVSQLIDSVSVMTITFGAAVLRGDMAASTLFQLIGSNYAFKFCAALADTVPFYICVHYLSRYLRLDPTQMHDEKV